MASNPISGDAAVVTYAFDPSQWLENFQNVGGAYVLTDEAVHLTAASAGASPDCLRRVCQMLSGLNPDQRDKISGLLRQREAQWFVETLGPDAAILAAWQRRQAAYLRYNTLPIAKADTPLHKHMTAEERECWAIIDAAEEVIGTTAATTTAAVLVQLWTALYHSVSGREDDEAITSGDLQRIAAVSDGFDWNAKLILAAIKSLQAMEA